MRFTRPNDLHVGGGRPSGGDAIGISGWWIYHNSTCGRIRHSRYTDAGYYIPDRAPWAPSYIPSRSAVANLIQTSAPWRMAGHEVGHRQSVGQIRESLGRAG